MAPILLKFTILIFAAVETAATPIANIKILMGSLKDDHLQTLPIKKHDADLIASLPENFDPRDKWPNCPSLNDIRDQGHCGSCWAFGAVSAMTDRVCIHSNGTKQFYFSAQDLVSCSQETGCFGGYPSAAWEYWKTNGLVSGGAYNSSEGCRPYEVETCKYHAPCTDFVTTPLCKSKCRPGYNIEYSKDKHYGNSVYTVTGQDQIKAELFTNGPVEASFEVYEDFVNYTSGVYMHTTGNSLGGHAVKMMGWGVEDGKKYWLLANSWNTVWGEQGYFKILRGENHCHIEEDTVAGEPALDG